MNLTLEKTKLVNLKQYYGNYKNRLHNLPYQSNNTINFINLISLSPDIELLNDNVIHKGKYFKFIIEAFNYYIKECEVDNEQTFDRFFNEDCDKYKEALIKFNEDSGDINKLKTFNDLLKLTSDNLDMSHYDVWLKLKHTLKNNNDYIHVFENEQQLIIIPLDYEIYLKLCEGAKYCTRVYKIFHQYSMSDPLYLIIPKKSKEINELYQIHIKSNQFKDYYDSNVNKNKFKLLNTSLYNWIKLWNNENLQWSEQKSKIYLNGFNDETTNKLINFLNQDLKLRLKLNNEELNIAIFEMNNIDCINFEKLIELSNIDCHNVWIDLYFKYNIKIKIKYDKFISIKNLIKKSNFDNLLIKFLDDEEIKIFNLNKLKIKDINSIKYPNLIHHILLNNEKTENMDKLLYEICTKNPLLDSVKYLIDKGADINYINRNQNSILIISAHYCDSKILDYLIKKWC